MNPSEFDAARRYVETSQGRIAYFEKGSGPVALFLHAYMLNGFQWRDLIDALSDTRRCIALDMLSMGHTEPKRGQDLTLAGQAEMIGEFLDQLGIDAVDLVGNDSGGGACQVFAARNPDRVRSMTLTNSEAQDNYPPEGLLPLVNAAKGGAFGGILNGMVSDPDSARQNMGGALYEDPATALTDDVVRTYIGPLVRSEESIADITRYTADMNPQSTLDVEGELQKLDVPTLVVWGTADPIFPIQWAHWLRDTIPGCKEIVEIEGGRLCFPEEHASELVAAIRKFWTASSTA